MIRYDNSLRRQSFNLPVLLMEQTDDLIRQVGQLFGGHEIEKIKRIILTGCGDSYAAGLAARYPLERLSGIPVQLISAIDFSAEYAKERLDKHTLVVAVSVSGNGTRIKEAVQKAVRCKAITLGITRDQDSDVGKAANRVLQLNISPFERGPGNRNYFVSLLALLYLGLELGYRREMYSRSRLSFYHQEIAYQGQQLEHLLPEIDKHVWAISEEWQSFINFDFIGSGMDYASAWFGSAKIIEALGAFTTHNNSEDWFHMNNFFKDVGHCGTVFLASTKNRAISRTAEGVRYAKRIGRPLFVISDGKKDDWGADVACIQVPASESYFPEMLTQYVPMCLLAGYMGAIHGERNCRGCLGSWEFAAGGAFIKNSQEIKS